MNLYRVLCLGVVSLLICIPALAQEKVPRFEASDCAIAIPKTEKHIECGELVVYENRQASRLKTIRLPIVILKTDAPDPRPDPVLKTLGGPGGSSLKMISGRSASPWLKDRDYIIFEQRGTRFAKPALDCPEVDAANIESAKKGLDRKHAGAAEIAAVRACYDRLGLAGIDLSSYNSAESAADIEDLRRALKVDKINLYGISYSARLMLDVMRYYPAGIRSVVLESVLPPEVNYDEVGVDAMVRSLNEMFAGCRADIECAKAYPDLEKEFYAVVAELNKTPLVVSTKDPKTGLMVDIRLNGDDFATWIVDYLFSNEPAATVNAPYAIHLAFGGRPIEPFKRYAADKLNGSFYTWGMRYSVWCSEELPFENKNKIKGQSTKYPGLKGYRIMTLPDVCSVWKVRAAPANANRPVSNDIPTLVFGAQYDAYTDPAWGKTAAGRLKNSFFFEVPWAGHGPGFAVPCVSRMIAEFIEKPFERPGSGCIEETKARFKFRIEKQP